MKLLPFTTLAIVTFSLYGSVESSIKIPIQEHLKYTFVHARNDAVAQLEYQGVMKKNSG